MSPLIDFILQFQFTHPGRGATGASYTNYFEDEVSIHAPREGCDCPLLFFGLGKEKFQFTHPGRGATTW